MLTSDLNSFKSSLMFKTWIVGGSTEKKFFKFDKLTILNHIKSNTIKVNKIIPTAITSKNLLPIQTLIVYIFNSF
jgi:hypothetical protein